MKNNFNNIFATFFMNELVIKLAASSKGDVMVYRQKLDSYSTAVASFVGQRNQVYDVIYENLMSYTLKYSPNNTIDTIVTTINASLCPPTTLMKFRSTDKTAVFRKYLVDSIKRMVVLSLSFSNDIIAQTTKPVEEQRLFRTSLLANFEDILEDIKRDIFMEFNNVGGNQNISEIRKIRTEQKMITELRQQNEDLHFTNLKLLEEVHKLKKKLTEYEVQFQEEEEVTDF